jgi:acetyl esterase/lipase
MKPGHPNQILPGTGRGTAPKAWWRGPASPLAKRARMGGTPPSLRATSSFDRLRTDGFRGGFGGMTIGPVVLNGLGIQ